MGLVQRVEDAELLWAKGRKEGAILSALVAFAATARRAGPSLKDREAFESYFRSRLGVVLSVEYQGRQETVEHIFYKWLRCELVHSGGLPVDIEIIEGGDESALIIGAGGSPDYVLRIGSGWYDFLVRAVMEDPRNSEDFPWRERWLERARLRRHS